MNELDTISKELKSLVTPGEQWEDVEWDFPDDEQLPEPTPIVKTNHKRPTATRKKVKSKRKTLKLQGPPPYRIFVGSVSMSSCEREIVDLFADFDVKHHEFAYDEENVFRGFFFLELQDKEQAESILKMNGVLLHDKKLKIDVALSKKRKEKPKTISKILTRKSSEGRIKKESPSKERVDPFGGAIPREVVLEQRICEEVKNPEEATLPKSENGGSVREGESRSMEQRDISDKVRKDVSGRSRKNMDKKHKKKHVRSRKGKYNKAKDGEGDTNEHKPKSKRKNGRRYRQKKGKPQKKTSKVADEGKSVEENNVPNQSPEEVKNVQPKKRQHTKKKKVVKGKKGKMESEDGIAFASVNPYSVLGSDV